MAFYEMLPGGMPSGLQAGMDSVLNKKFGTSTTYPAEGWPDTVNLMGPLPEKTASGAIVTFSDGADEVPIKSWEVSLPASLDGYSEIDVYHAGSNVWDEDYALGFWNASGEWYGNTQGYMSSKTHISVKPSTQYCFINGGNTSFYICYYDKNKTFIRRDTLAYPSQRVITTPSNCYFVNFSTYSAYGTTYNNDIALNYPSTFTEYAHYSGTTSAVNLGRTIYGGTADVVNGTGTATIDEHGDPIDPPETFTFTPITPTPETALGVNNFWAEQGDSSVTYRADINLALGGN